MHILRKRGAEACKGAAAEADIVDEDATWR